jgi:dynein heavy chain, axonemal
LKQTTPNLQRTLG